MAEGFGIACHELVNLDFRCGSQPEVSDGHENVCFWLDSDLTATPDLRPLYPQLRT